MADDDDRDDESGAGAPSAAAKPKRGRPPGAKTGTGKRGRPPTQRFERRSSKSAETVRELIRLRMPELDVSELTFSETVERDADAWGDFLAQLGEWFVPLGTALDLIFGVALVRVLRMAPSVRAARRDLAVARERRLAERAERDAAEEHAAAVEAQRQAAVAPGVFDPAPEMTREEWSAGRRAGYDAGAAVDANG